MITVKAQKDFFYRNKFSRKEKETIIYNSKIVIRIPAAYEYVVNGNPLSNG
jgi:predicted helicase